MLLHAVLLITTIYSSQGLPRPQAPTQSNGYDPKQVFFVPQRQQYNPGLQYDLSVLEPQFQIPPYNFIGDKQHFPSVQPQIVLYHGGAAPGQPFLLQPGSPPGNFLVPQGGPNVILREAPSAPPRPVFVAGYPKPAHIPPIEKDAEEVPTNPSKIPPLRPKGENKPEKLETFNEDDDNSKKQASEADVLAEADRNPAFNTKTNLRPGQRFFILNGQPLFSNYPYTNNVYPGINLKYSSFIPQTPVKKVSVFKSGKDVPIGYSDSFFRSNKQDVPVGYPENLFKSNKDNAPVGYPDNLVLLNQPGSFQEPYFRKQEAQYDDGQYGLVQDDDSVVIDAEQQRDEEQEQEEEEPEMEDEVVSAAEKQNEPTIAQAQPGAIALAGPGGVAAAAPRGTAFVGKDGVAVSSPRATAVAGPSRQEGTEEKKKNKKP